MYVFVQKRLIGKCGIRLFDIDRTWLKCMCAFIVGIVNIISLWTKLPSCRNHVSYRTTSSSYLCRLEYSLWAKYVTTNGIQAYRHVKETNSQCNLSYIYIHWWFLTNCYRSRLFLNLFFSFQYIWNLKKTFFFVNYLLYIKYGHFSDIMCICQTNHFKNIRLFYPSANGLLPNKFGFLLSLQQKS
jgi:hypothetical protein